MSSLYRTMINKVIWALGVILLELNDGGCIRDNTFMKCKPLS